MAKNFIITGCASGIGLATAKDMLSKGHNVSACDINNDGLKHAFQDAPKEQLLLHGLDVRSAGQWQEVIDKTVKHFGSVDYLLNIAGIVLPGFVQDMQIKDIDSHMDINGKGSMYGAKLCADQMIRQGHGHIINISSLAGLNPTSGLAAYSASKYAIRAFSVAMAGDLAQSGVKVSVICPDLVNTPMLAQELEFEKEAALVFTGSRPLEIHEVVDAIHHVMAKKPLLYSLPKSRGLLCKAGDLLPAVNFHLSRQIRKRGEKKIRKTNEAKQTA